MSKKISNLIDNLLCNSSGAIDPQSAGYQFVIDTLSFIDSKVIEQKFYTVPIADFIPVDVGKAAFSSEIVKNLVFQTGGDFYAGDINANAGVGREATAGAFVEPTRIPTQLWQKKTTWGTVEIKQAAATGRWDVIEERIKSLKKDWDLGIQKTAFLGHPYIKTMTGLINNADCYGNRNTSIITVPMSLMTMAQIKVVLAQMIAAYWKNSNYTALPDTFIMPSTDFMGMADFVSDTYPLMTKIEAIKQMFKEITGAANFKIGHVAYLQADKNSARNVNANRYILYRNDPETLSMNIPIDFTMLPADTGDQVSWSQGAYGQYSGVLITRPLEVLYLDQTGTST